MGKNIYSEIGRSSVKYHNKIRGLTEHLDLFLGVDRFWRNFHGMDGTYSTLDNNPSLNEIYFGNDLEFVRGHPYFRNPRFFQSGYTTPELYKNEDYEKTEGKFRDIGGCYHVLMHFRKTESGFVEYGFARSKQQKGFESTYLNNLSAIERFMDFFEDQASTIIQESLEHRVNMAELIGESYNERPDITCKTLGPERELSFMVSLDENSEKTRSLLSLTKGERHCLKLYLSGKTAGEIANRLHRSTRTIEMHLYNAKGKLGVRSRSELLALLNPFRDYL